MECKFIDDKKCPILTNDLDNIHICNGYITDSPVFVYIVRCNDGTFYTGFTTNLENRIHLHKIGKGAKWTKAHGVKEYTYIQCDCRKNGLKIERQIKKNWNRTKKEALFAMYGTYQ